MTGLRDHYQWVQHIRATWWLSCISGQYSEDEGGEEAKDQSVFVGVTGEVCHRYQMREEKVEYQVA